jgi:hypothetical protein
MTKNPILEALHTTRERLLAEAGNTLDGLVAQLQQEERDSERPFLDSGPGSTDSGSTARSNNTDQQPQAN